MPDLIQDRACDLLRIADIPLELEQPFDHVLGGGVRALRLARDLHQKLRDLVDFEGLERGLVGARGGDAYREGDRVFAQGLEERGVLEGHGIDAANQPTRSDELIVDVTRGLALLALVTATQHELLFGQAAAWVERERLATQLRRQAPLDGTSSHRFCAIRNHARERAEQLIRTEHGALRARARCTGEPKRQREDEQRAGHETEGMEPGDWHVVLPALPADIRRALTLPV